MNIFGTLSVFPQVPTRLQRLPELAYNLWWSWNPDAQALFATMDESLWDAVSHNPVKFLREVSQERLNEAAGDAALAALRRSDGRVRRLHESGIDLVRARTPTS